jgi:hypothetical protein
MPGRKSFLAEELSKFWEALWLDIPAQAGKIMLGIGNEHEFRKAGWKAYDAWVNLANEVTNAIYSDPVIGEASGQMMEAALRLRQVGDTIAAAFFGNLWPSIGLPTHAEIVALRDDLLALREELAAYAARLPLDSNSIETNTDDVPRGTWRETPLNGARSNGYRLSGSNLSPASAAQGKRYDAAR